MSFNVLFLSHSSDANSDLHRSKIDTGKYKLWTIVVQNQEEALSVAKSFVAEKEIDSILLCPGFTHIDVAEMFNAFDGRVGVFVARGDGVSGRITAKARTRAFGD